MVEQGWEDGDGRRMGGEWKRVWEDGGRVVGGGCQRMEEGLKEGVGRWMAGGCEED